MNLAKLSLDKTPPTDFEPAGTLRWDASLTDMADFFGSDKGTLKHNYTASRAPEVRAGQPAGDRRGVRSVAQDVVALLPVRPHHWRGHPH
jgi:hypothetical protein